MEQKIIIVKIPFLAVVPKYLFYSLTTTVVSYQIESVSSKMRAAHGASIPLSYERRRVQRGSSHFDETLSI